MSKYKRAMEQTEMPKDCEKRIRDMITAGNMREVVPFGRRVMGIGVAAAAAVMLLMGGTLAVSGGWNDLVDIFQARNEGVYTETQIAQITELEENVDLSVESNGITVTVDSVLTADNSVDVLLRVEGENIELRGDAHYSFYNFKSSVVSELTQYFGEDTKAVTCASVGVSENAVYVLFHREHYETPSRSLRNGDYRLVLSLEEFYEYGESRGDEKKRYGGEWEFELPLREVSREKRIVLEDLTLSCCNMEYPERRATLLHADELIITSSCVWVNYTASDSGAVVLEIQAVMKDGAVIGTDNVSGHGYEEQGTVGCSWTEIVQLEEIDHLLIGGEIVPILQT